MQHKMIIPDFNYHRPSTINEAVELLSNSNDAVPVAGGTDLLVEIKMGLRQHQAIVSLNALNELKTIDESDGKLHIGSGVTHNMLIESSLIKEKYPALAEAAISIGTTQIRNRGTVGGNLCTAASCCDMGPILIAMNASVHIISSTGERQLPLKEFFLHHKKTVLSKGEILSGITMAIPSENTGAVYIKFGLRESASISVASVAVVLTQNSDNMISGNVAIGAVAPTPVISKSANSVLDGVKREDLYEGSEILRNAGEGSATDSIPLDDIRGTAMYRKHLIKTLTQKAVLKALERLPI